jgi:hypothetical protein
MKGATRAISTLAGIAAAGVLLWAAAQVGRHSTGGYWASYAIAAAAGLVLGLSQLRGRTGKPVALLVTCFVPVLVVAGWVLLAMQPHSNWFRGHVLNWSGDLGIRGVVLDLGTWLGVLALGIGYTLAVSLEPAPRRQVVTAPAPATEIEPATVHDVEPVQAEPVPAEPVPAEPVPAEQQREVVATNREEVPAR